MWRAHDTGTDRPVAVKLLVPQLAGAEAFVQRFGREAHAATRVSVPQVMPIHDGEIDGRLYVDMRLYRWPRPTRRVGRRVEASDGSSSVVGYAGTAVRGASRILQGVGSTLP